jgi:hypothetical protein
MVLAERRIHALEVGAVAQSHAVRDGGEVARNRKHHRAARRPDGAEAMTKKPLTAAEMGKKGGSATTDAKRKAARKNLKKARKTRWIQPA